MVAKLPEFERTKKFLAARKLFGVREEEEEEKKKKRGTIEGEEENEAGKKMKGE